MEKIELESREEIVNKLTKAGFIVKDGKLFYWSNKKYSFSFPGNKLGSDIVIEAYSPLKAEEKSRRGTKMFEFCVNLNDIEKVEILCSPKDGDKLWKGITLLGLREA